MGILEILSWLATALACIANIPQVWRVYKNKSAANISLLTNSLWLGIVIVMFLRALLIVGDPVFIVSQGAQTLIMAILFVALLKYRRAR